MAGDCPEWQVRHRCGDIGCGIHAYLFDHDTSIVGDEVHKLSEGGWAGPHWWVHQARMCSHLNVIAQAVLQAVVQGRVGDNYSGSPLETCALEELAARSGTVVDDHIGHECAGG